MMLAIKKKEGDKEKLNKKSFVVFRSQNLRLWQSKFKQIFVNKQ